MITSTMKSKKLDFYKPSVVSKLRGSNLSMFINPEIGFIESRTWKTQMHVAKAFVTDALMNVAQGLVNDDLIRHTPDQSLDNLT